MAQSYTPLCGLPFTYLPSTYKYHCHRDGAVVTGHHANPTAVLCSLPTMPIDFNLSSSKSAARASAAVKAVMDAIKAVGM